MMALRREWTVVLALVALVPPRAMAQGGEDFVTRGVRAYHNVQLDLAASVLRRALAESLSVASRVRALTFLGATEVLRGASYQRAAVEAFRDVLLLDPTQRPDQLVFPPRVVSVFEVVRQMTKAVRVDPHEAEGAFVAAVYATSSHEIVALVVREDGRLVRTLYVGPAGDSLELRWDGRDSANAYVAPGRYLLRVGSRLSSTGPIVRQVQLPLETELVVPDTLPLPDPLGAAQLLPENYTWTAGLRSLMLGLAAGGAVLVLPSLVADGAEPSDARFVVAGAVSLAGLVGLVTQPGRRLPRNIAENERRRDEWRQRREATAAENVERRGAIRFAVRAGSPTVIDAEAGR